LWHVFVCMTTQRSRTPTDTRRDRVPATNPRSRSPGATRRSRSPTICRSRSPATRHDREPAKTCCSRSTTASRCSLSNTSGESRAIPNQTVEAHQSQQPRHAEVTQAQADVAATRAAAAQAAAEAAAAEAEVAMLVAKAAKAKAKAKMMSARAFAAAGDNGSATACASMTSSSADRSPDRKVSSAATASSAARTRGIGERRGKIGHIASECDTQPEPKKQFLVPKAGCVTSKALPEELAASSGRMRCGIPQGNPKNATIVKATSSKGEPSTKGDSYIREPAGDGHSSDCAGFSSGTYHSEQWVPSNDVELVGKGHEGFIYRLDSSGTAWREVYAKLKFTELKVRPSANNAPITICRLDMIYQRSAAAESSRQMAVEQVLYAKGKHGYLGGFVRRDGGPTAEPPLDTPSYFSVHGINRCHMYCVPSDEDRCEWLDAIDRLAELRVDWVEAQSEGDYSLKERIYEAMDVRMPRQIQAWKEGKIIAPDFPRTGKIARYMRKLALRPGVVRHDMLIHPFDGARLVGKSGSGVRRIEEKTGCKLFCLIHEGAPPDCPPEMRLLCFYGSDEQVSQAVQKVHELHQMWEAEVTESAKKQPPQQAAQAQAAMARVIAEAQLAQAQAQARAMGQTQTQGHAQALTQTHTQTQPQQSQLRLVAPQQHPQWLQHAPQLPQLPLPISSEISPRSSECNPSSTPLGALPQHQMPLPTAQLAISAASTSQHGRVPHKLCAKLIGVGGSKIAEIRISSGARIEIETSVVVDTDSGSDMRPVKITGSPGQIEHAIMLIQQLIGSSAWKSVGSS